jgi:pyruvate/2-oxoglutarate dehydrogenase complex dihydrolipoamide dehydrogenase (E3) component
MSESFEMIVVGAGQAGPFLAAKLAQQGQRVALVESRHLGGTCINEGCTPTKTLRKSARVAYLARRGAEFGVRTGPVAVDFAAAMDRMQRRVDESRGGLQRWLAGLPHLSIVMARARLAGREGDQFVVEAGGRRLLAPKLVLNTGTRPLIPPIAGLGAVPFLDNESLLALRSRPAHLIVIGGSYIGLEMGQIFRRLGSEVTVIEPGPRVTAREDEDVSAAVAQMLHDEGLAVHTGVGVASVAREPDGAVCVLLSDGRRLAGSHLLVATGRVPNTDQLGLNSIGLATGPRGYIATNERLETAVQGVWALGDINQRGAFTHTSYHDHEILAANLAGGSRSADARIPTYAMFTDPPLGHVGLYEADARRLVARQGRHITQAVIAMKDVSRAKEESETVGLIKLLVDEDSGLFVGASMLGINADEIIQVIGQLMAAGGGWRGVRDALPVHPTVTEFLPTLLDRRRPLVGV